LFNIHNKNVNSCGTVTTWFTVSPKGGNVKTISSLKTKKERKMKIITDYKTNEYLMIPVTNQDDFERLKIEEHILNNEGLMTYKGFEIDTWDIRLLFRVKNEKICITGDSHDINIILMQQSLFHGPKQLIYRHSPKITEHIFGIGFAIKICPLCETEVFGESIIGFAASWGICDKCAMRCKHYFITGNIFSVKPRHGLTIGKGEFCNKCGRSRKMLSRKKFSPYNIEIGDKNENKKRSQ
jgi:hypothetical protein